MKADRKAFSLSSLGAKTWCNSCKKNHMVKTWRCSCDLPWYQCETHGKDPHEAEGDLVLQQTVPVRPSKDKKVDFAMVEVKKSRARNQPEQGFKLRASFLSAGLKRKFGHLCDVS